MSAYNAFHARHGHYAEEYGGYGLYDGFDGVDDLGYQNPMADELRAAQLHAYLTDPSMGGVDEDQMDWNGQGHDDYVDDLAEFDEDYEEPPRKDPWAGDEYFGNFADYVSSDDESYEPSDTEDTEDQLGDPVKGESTPQEGVAGLLLDMLERELEPLRSLLSTSDLFCIRLTCRRAWRTIKHPTVHRGNVLRTAITDKHAALALWGLQVGRRRSTFSFAWCIERLAEMGDPEILAVLKAMPNRSKSDKAVRAAVRRGAGHCEWWKLERLRTDVHYRRNFSRQDFNEIALTGQLSVAQYVKPEVAFWRDDRLLFEYVLGSGNLAFVEWMLSEGPVREWTTVSLARIGSSGSVPILELVLQRGGATMQHVRRDLKWLTQCAVEGGHTELVRWLGDRGECDMSQREMVGLAVEGGHVELAEYALSRQPTPGRPTIGHARVAARAGHLAMLQWLLPNIAKVPNNGALPLRAVSNTQCFMWLVKRPMFYDPVKCAAAAAKENPEVAVIIHRSTGILDARALTLAISCGDYDSYRYLVDVAGVQLEGMHLRLMLQGDEVEMMEHNVRRRYHRISSELREEMEGVAAVEGWDTDGVDDFGNYNCYLKQYQTWVVKRPGIPGTASNDMKRMLEKHKQWKPVR
jgi:hypothetical protein